MVSHKKNNKKRDGKKLTRKKIGVEHKVTENEKYCKQEARITAIETRLDSKKEHIHEVDEDYYHLREKLEIISTNVVELTTLMREAQKKEDENDKKIDAMKTEIANLKIDIADVDKKIDSTNSSIETIKWLVPVICAILTFIVNYLI